MRMRALAAPLLLLFSGVAQAEAPKPPAGLPLAPARHLDITTRSGSWMSLALSPDGRTILFDLLGDVYALPAKGGKAHPVLEGLAFETQPVFSPDGRWIAFVSDRSGADNLWIARPDGSAPRRISDRDDDTVLTSPEWSADGRAIFVSRYRADLNNYELWRHTLSGEAELIAPIRATPAAARTGFQSTLGASASRDGKWLYVARRTGGLDFDAVKAWTIIRRDLATGAETVVVSGSGGRGADSETFFRPQISPDGRKLAYATRRDGTTWLRVRDLIDGSDRALGEADFDALQASSWQDLLPRYAFTPDGSALILSHKGGFERRPLDGAAATALPFEARMRVAVAPTTRIRIREDEGPVRSRLAMAPVAAPDGGRIAFAALGGLYVQAAGSDRPPRRLDQVPGPAFQPSWSPDGTRIAYVSWTEGAGGTIWSIAADGTAPPTRISALPAYYSYPVFTPDGANIVVIRSSMAARQQTNFEVGQLREAELVMMPATGGAARVLTSGRIGARPHFSARPGTVYVLAGDGLNAVDLATGRRERIVQVKGPGWYFQEGTAAVDDLRLSPDGKWLAALIAQQLHIVAMPTDGATEIDLLDTRLPHRRITDIGADYFEWTRDGGIDWSVGSSFLHAAIPLVGDAARTDLTVTLPRARPTGRLLLRGGRALTMADGDRVIADADILIENDRIAAIGPRGTVPIPPDTVIRDIAGKIVVPGFIDVHDHFGSIRRDVLSLEDWALRARLAYGVTTCFDPSTLSIDTLAYQDLIDAGLMLGPRIRSTGQALFSMNRFQSLDEVRAVLRRYREAYGLRNIKEYRTGNRRVRQWVAIAARELGLLPTTEGALSLKLDLTQILDGFAGNEHALPAPPLGDDVLALLVAMRTSYTTTLLITNSGGPAADWFVATRDIVRDEKIRRFWSPAAIDQKLADRPWQALETLRFPIIAADAARIAARGGLIGMGAHGEVPGIGFHWEMEAHGIGGMAPMAVLHAATAGSAETIGRLDDLGTLEPGKLADLVILDRDPVTDIRNTLAIDGVMRGGTLFDGRTLDTQWPVAAPLPPPWFAAAGDQHWLPARAQRR